MRVGGGGWGGWWWWGGGHGSKNLVIDKEAGGAAAKQGAGQERGHQLLVHCALQLWQLSTTCVHRKGGGVRTAL